MLTILKLKRAVHSRKNKNKNTIYNCSRKMKYLGTNLNKHVQNFYSKNYKMLMKDVKEDLHKYLWI